MEEVYNGRRVDLVRELDVSGRIVGSGGSPDRGGLNPEALAEASRQQTLLGKLDRSLPPICRVGRRPSAANLRSRLGLRRECCRASARFTGPPPRVRRPVRAPLLGQDGGRRSACQSPGRERVCRHVGRKSLPPPPASRLRGSQRLCRKKVCQHGSSRKGSPQWSRLPSLPASKPTSWLANALSWMLGGRACRSHARADAWRARSRISDRAGSNSATIPSEKHLAASQLAGKLACQFSRRRSVGRRSAPRRGTSPKRRAAIRRAPQLRGRRLRAP